MIRKIAIAVCLLLALATAGVWAAHDPNDFFKLIGTRSKNLGGPHHVAIHDGALGGLHGEDCGGMTWIFDYPRLSGSMMRINSSNPPFSMAGFMFDRPRLNNGDVQTVYRIPLWMLTAAFMAYPIWYLVTWLVGLRGAEPGECPVCAYDLRGSPGAECPECGDPVSQ